MSARVPRLGLDEMPQNLVQYLNSHQRGLEMTQPIWITEQDVVELLDLGDAIAALEKGLRQEASGQAQNMTKTQLTWGHNNLHAIGAVFTEQRLAATKTWAHTEGGATPLSFVIGADDGSIKAIIEAFALGQMRTGGISGVATDWLAAPDAASSRSSVPASRRFCKWPRSTPFGRSSACAYSARAPKAASSSSRRPAGSWIWK